jgi:GTP-binding protein
VGAFAFTTLEPALGDLYGLVLADIPGLIEGASEGRGLGHKFLRHIERTKALLHLISSEEEDPLKTYEIVRNELELYNKEIVEKEEVIVLTKTDLISEEEKEAKLKALKTLGKPVFALSIIDDKAITELSNFLTQTFRV